MNLINPFKTRSLSRKLALSLSIALIMVGGIALSLYLFLSKYQARLDLTIKSQEYLNAMSETLALPLWDVDEPKIKAICNAYARNDLIGVIKVTSAGGYSYFDMTKPGSIIMNLNTAAIIHNGEKIGRLSLGLTTDYYNMLYQRFFWFYTSSLILMILSLSFIIHILLGKYFRNPLTQFVSMVEAYALGNEDAFQKQSLYIESEPFIKVLKEMGNTISQQIKSLKLTQYAIDKNIISTYWINQQGNIIYTNEAACRTSGFTQAEMINLCIEDIIHDWNIYKKKGQISENKGSAFFESYQYNKDGTTCPVEVTANFLRYSQENFIFAFVTDIRERKEAEKHLQQTQKMDCIGSLAGGIAHDFNNLLCPIIGMSEMLLSEMPSDSLKHKKVQTIYQAGVRAGDLVKQILSFSRQSKLKKMPVQIQRILIEVIKLIRSTIPSDIEITVDIDNDCGSVIAEPTQIHQIIMNLITNAYHALGNSNREISLSLKEITQEEGQKQGISAAAARYASFSVTDKGCGIDETVLDKIFNPYFTTKEPGKGTGLGLAVVYGIVKEHGGEIKVFSTPGKGSSFNVYLPLMETPLEIVENALTEKYQIGTEQILIVDDEESVVMQEKHILEGLGYRVRSCLNSLDALEIFKTHSSDFDLVITDMTMPFMTGDQFTRELLSIRPDISVIICTGFSERINREKAEALGIKGFLMKPFHKYDMAQMVRKVIDESKGITP